MSGIFYTQRLAMTSRMGMAEHKAEVYIPELQIFANILLSHYRTTTPNNFNPRQESWAEAFIVTPQTPPVPLTGGMGPAFLQRDPTVYLKTDQLTFYLQVSNGGGGLPGNPNLEASASAVCVIYDYSPSPTLDMASVVQQLDLAVYAEDGTVVATHQSVRLAGGREFDEDETRERVLADAYAMRERKQGSLRVATLGYGQMPVHTDFRVDPSTGQAEPLSGQASGENLVRP